MSVITPQRQGLVDTIGSGYRAINRRLWVVIVPIGLSAYLWFGAPLLISNGSALRERLHDAAGLLSSSPQSQEALVERVLTSDVRLLLAWLNFVPILAPLPAAAPVSAPIQLGGTLQLVGASLVINCMALLLSSLFLTQLSEAVRGERLHLRELLGRALLAARDIALYLLAILGVGLILALPFLAISVIVIVALPAAAVPVLIAWYVALFWAYVYTGLAPEAIVISQAGPLRAIYNSVRVVRRNLAGTVGLLLISFLVASGLGVIWQQLSSSPFGLALAIFGSAYVGSGLSAARLEFYRDRFARAQHGP